MRWLDATSASMLEVLAAFTGRQFSDTPNAQCRFAWDHLEVHIFGLAPLITTTLDIFSGRLPACRALKTSLEFPFSFAFPDFYLSVTKTIISFVDVFRIWSSYLSCIVLISFEYCPNITLTVFDYLSILWITSQEFFEYHLKKKIRSHFNISRIP